MTEQGRKLLIARGLPLKAYKDSVGVWTIGSAIRPARAAGRKAGHAHHPGQADPIFADDVAEFEDGVTRPRLALRSSRTGSTPMSASPSTSASALRLLDHVRSCSTARTIAAARRSCF